MIKIIENNDKDEFENKVNELLSQGYKLSSSNCGYAGEIGNSVYDCNYYMAVLINRECNMNANKLWKDLGLITKYNDYNNISICDNETLEEIIEFRNDANKKVVAIEAEKSDRIILDIPILKAIQQQMKELGW